MTEASENGCYLVRVRAQVMSRDEQADGWVPGAGGGLADVRVGKRRVYKGENGDKSTTAVLASHEYYIHGTRISDNVVVLECTIKKDFHYNKVMPTFHHWVTDGQRFGLTFQTAADARAFDRGVRTAVEDLLEGLGGAWPSLHAYKERNPVPKEEDEEQNIFECLNLPCSSRSSSENSSASRRPRTMDSETPILCSIALPQHGGEGKYDAMYHHSDENPYVSLTALHEYTYPAVGPGGIISSEKSSPNTKPPLLTRDSGSIKKYSDMPTLKKPNVEGYQPRLKCRHCHEWYFESSNRPGACEYAPDGFKSCIETVSCMKCARCMVYHCMADSEGDFNLHPCSCGTPDEQCAKRTMYTLLQQNSNWIGVTLLSLVVPCLCCYLPLRCIRQTATKIRGNGPIHKPIIP